MKIKIKIRMKKKNILNIKKINNIDLIPNYYSAGGSSEAAAANGKVAFAKQKAVYTNNLFIMCSSTPTTQTQQKDSVSFQKAPLHSARTQVPSIMEQPSTSGVWSKDQGQAS